MLAKVLCNNALLRSYMFNTRIRFRWGAIANPHANIFDRPAPQVSPPGAWPRQQNENSIQYVFYPLFVRTHTNFSIKIFETDFVTEI